MKPAQTGYYGIVQYCPDHSRMEAANLGVVLLVPGTGFLGCRMSPGNERLKRFFGEQSGDLGQIRAMKRNLVNRLEKDPELRDLGKFENFRSQLCNEIQITVLREVRVEDPRVELAQLYSELVESPDVREPVVRPAVFERLDEIMLGASIAPLIQRDLKIHVPVLERDIEVAYAFQNGSLNLIQPQTFRHKSESEIIKAACSTAVQGDLLARHPIPEIGACKLVVVGALQDAAEETRRRLDRMFSEYAVEFYTDDTLDLLTERIIKTAH